MPVHQNNETHSGVDQKSKKVRGILMAASMAWKTASDDTAP
jgi:hypothetical protein